MKTKQAKQISEDFNIDETYKRLDIKDFKLPQFTPMPDIGNITNAYLSAFNTGMTIYECLSWLQGYVQANRDALVQLIGDLTKFQASIEAALNELVKNMRELDAKLQTETEERKAADIVLDGKITAEATKREEEDGKLSAKIDQTKEELNTKIDDTKTELDTKIDDTKTELDTKIDNTKQNLEGQISSVTVDTSGLVKKSGDTMDGNLIFSDLSDPPQAGRGRFITCLNYGKPSGGTGILFKTYEKSYESEDSPISFSSIQEKIQRRWTNNNEKEDILTGIFFTNMKDDKIGADGTTYNRMVFNTPGRLIVRDGTETDEEKNSSVLYGEKVAYLSDCYIIDDLSDKLTEVPQNNKTHTLVSDENVHQFPLFFGDLEGYDSFIVNMTIEGALAMPGEHNTTITLLITKDDEQDLTGRGGSLQTIVTKDMHLIYISSGGITNSPFKGPIVKYSQNTGAQLTLTTNYLKGIRRG